MPFVLEPVEVPLAAFDAHGCLAPTGQRRLGRLRLAARSVVKLARDDAAALLTVAQAEASALQSAALDQRHQLQAEHEAAWQGARASLQAAAIAIASLALRRLHVELGAAEKLQAALQLALQALPEPPVRLLVSGTYGSTPVPLVLPASAAREDAPGAQRAVELHGVARSTGVGVNTAWAQVHRALDTWLAELVQARVEPLGEPEVADPPPTKD
jgi:hypothetical protein